MCDLMQEAVLSCWKQENIEELLSRASLEWQVSRPLCMLYIWGLEKKTHNIRSFSELPENTWNITCTIYYSWTSSASTDFVMVLWTPLNHSLFHPKANNLLREDLSGKCLCLRCLRNHKWIVPPPLHQVWDLAASRYPQLVETGLQSAWYIWEIHVSLFSCLEWA